MMKSSVERTSVAIGKFEHFEELDECLHIHFKKKAKEIPDKIAVVDGTRKITYAELDKKTDQLAFFIEKEFGIELDDPIGIYMEKSIEYVISYIAILKAGGAYSPIELSYPPQMIERITREITVKGILVKRKDLLVNIPKNQATYCFEDWEKDVGKIDPSKCFVKNNPQPYNLAYLVFSSGSTGEPKAIACPHIGSLNSYFSRIKEYPYDGEEREGANIFFTWELLRPLLGGITLYVIPQEVIYDPYQLTDFVEKHELTRFLVTPSTLQTVMDIFENKKEVLKKKFKTLKTVLFCGEVVHKTLFDSFYSLFPNVSMLNLYSVSECHDVSCCDLRDYKHDESHFCTTGHLLENVFGYIVDRNSGQILPFGATGELYVGGITLAREYMGMQGKKLSEDRFPMNNYPLPEGLKELPSYMKDYRLYKSGDSARFRSDGTLELLGRCNDMVKIRGYSIELPAVESYLNKHEKIASSVVIKDKQERLLGYVVLGPEVKTINGLEIKEFLSQHLPVYMIPNILMRIEKLPISDIGKLDKKDLPVPEDRPELRIELRTKKGMKIDLPKDEWESKLQKIWGKIFDSEDDGIGVNDNFFYLGGTSLMMANLYVLITEEFWNVKKEEEEEGEEEEEVEAVKCPIQIHMLNTHQTIRSQAELIRKYKEMPSGSEVEGHQFSFHEDCELDFEVKESAPKLDEKELKFAPEGKWRILLTGASGYLGAFLLTSILRKYPNSLVYCIVRKEGGRQRLITNLKYYKLYDDYMRQKMIEHVLIVKGDFSKSDLAIGNPEYMRLSKEIDMVIHNGANVNFLRSYDQMRNENVLGTLRLISFSLTSKVKPFIYVSTSGVYDRLRGPEYMFKKEDEVSSKVEELTMGYCQSKWVAENLCRKAMSKEKLPVLIFRPGDLVGDVNGCYNPSHDLIKYLQAVVRMKSYPLDSSQFDLTPVDFVADAIVKQVSETRFVDGGEMKEKMKYQYNVIHPYLIRNMDIMRFLETELGYEGLYGVSCDQWVEMIKKDGMENPLYSIFPVLNRDRFNLPDVCFETTLFSLDCRRKSKKAWKLPSPIVLLKKMFKRMVENGDIEVTPETMIFNQTAVVTGASAGIGRAIGMDLAKGGMNVVISARRKEVLEEICQETMKNKKYEFVGDIIAVQCDVTKPEEVERMVEVAKKKFGGIDVFVSNAGVMPTTLMKNAKVDEWRNCVNVNVNGFLNCVGAVIQEFVEKKNGHFVNISSDAGRDVWETLVVYSASKFFMEAVSKGMRNELGKLGIRTTTIQPGDVAETEILASNQSDPEGMKQLEGMFAKKMLKVGDISKAVLFAIKQPKNCAVNEILIEPIE